MVLKSCSVSSKVNCFLKCSVHDRFFVSFKFDRISYLEKYLLMQWILGVSISKFLLWSRPPKKAPHGQKKLHPTLTTPKEAKRPKGQKAERMLKELKPRMFLYLSTSAYTLLQISCVIIIWYIPEPIIDNGSMIQLFQFKL